LATCNCDTVYSVVLQPGPAQFCAAAAAEGPSQTTILGAVAVVVAGAAAVAAAGKQGELPSVGQVQASQAADKAKGRPASKHDVTESST